jgi:hypothetical protein
LQSCRIWRRTATCIRAIPTRQLADARRVLYSQREKAVAGPH